MTPLETLQRLRKNYPTLMSDVQIAEMLNEAAWIHRAEGYGLLLKRPPQSHVLLPNGVAVARDILFHKPSVIHYDCLVNSDGPCTPTWQNKGPAPISDWVAPLDPGGVVEPPVPPIPPQPPVVVPQPPITSYDSWVSGADFQILNAAFVAKYGVEPHAEYWRHLSYRRLVERWTIPAMVKDL